MIYEILNDAGVAINKIVADHAFVESQFPGHWRVAAGEQPDVEMPVAIPDSVPMLNAHLLLIREGKLGQLIELVAALPDPDRQEVEAYLNLAQTFRRDNKWVQQFGPVLGYTPAGMDQFFILAAALNP